MAAPPPQASMSQAAFAALQVVYFMNMRVSKIYLFIIIFLFFSLNEHMLGTD